MRLSTHYKRLLGTSTVIDTKDLKILLSDILKQNSFDCTQLAPIYGRFCHIGSIHARIFALYKALCVYSSQLMACHIKLTLQLTIIIPLAEFIATTASS